MITFQNPGLIDLRAITTMGVSVKENDNPIGYFGTGLKYAIAVILREGGSITLHRGEDTHEFTAIQETIRGKTFNTVWMSNPGEEALTQLGITTDLGKNWQAWQAYRELACNAIDEGGITVATRRLSKPDTTTFVVNNFPAFEAAHRDRHSIILGESARPIFEIPNSVQVFPNPSRSKYVFYRGIRAFECESAPIFMYNILAPCALTEDRTLRAGESDLNHEIRSILWHGSQFPEWMHEVFSYRNDGAYEQQAMMGLHDSTIINLRDPVMEKIASMARDRKHLVPDNFMRCLQSRIPDSFLPEPVTLTSQQQKMLDEATKIATAAGYGPNGYDVRVLQEIAGSSSILGRFIRPNYILLSISAFDTVEMLAGTIMEEVIHGATGHGDNTRGLQNYLVEALVAMTQRVMRAEQQQEEA